MRKIILMLAIWVGTVASADVSGEWAVTGALDAASIAKGAPQDASLVCQFRQDRDRLTGSCRPASGPDGVSVVGSVQEQRVEWRFDIALSPDAKKNTVTYSGTVNDAGTDMKGTFSIADVRGEFTAKRP